MDEFPSQRDFNGVTDAHNPGPGGSGERKWKSYKLLIDPILKKGQQKLYRYDGVAPGPSGADFSVKIVRDPRSRLSRFWKGREKYDLPVPKFKSDKYYVGELPPKQCTITNLNDNVREAFLRNMCEKFGTVEDINICCHPKTRKHLGLASVTFSTTRAAKQAVLELNRTSVMGKIIIVQIDAGGTECERIFDCLVNSSTPSSSSSTPRDPRHGLATPDTPTPRSAGAGDPRRLSLESKTPLTSEGTPLSLPDHPFAFPEPPPVGYPMGSDQGFPVPPRPSTTPGLSGNFAGMNMQDYGGNPPGPFPQDFNRGGMEQYPPHSGNFMPPEHHGMFPRPPLEQRGLPPGFQDPNTNMPYPPQMPPLHSMPMQPGFHPGHPNTNYNMYHDSQAWDHQNYGQQGTGDGYGYSNQQQDAQLGYGNQGQPGQWEHQFNRSSSHQDFQAHKRQDSDSSYSHGSYAERDQPRDDFSDRRSKTKSRNHQRDLPASADEDSNTADSKLATERAAATAVQDKEVKPPATEEEEDEAASDTGELNMSLDSRIEALLQRQSGMGFGFELDSSLNSGQDSTSNNVGGEFSPCPSPMAGDSPLLDEGSQTTTLQESSREHSPAPHPRYDSVVSKHWETQDTSKSHKSRVDKLHLERQLGHASYKRLQHSREGSTTDGFAADDSCSRDSITSTPEIRDMDKASTIPSGASTPTVNENTSNLSIGSLINRGLSNLRNITDQVPSPAISASPFVEHQGSIDDSLGSTPVESEPQTSRLLSDTQTEKQVQIEIADALASRNLPGGSLSDMDVDDDRMSMSSISSGEDTKLEVNVPIPQPNESRTYGPPMPPPPAPPGLSSQSSARYQWPGVSLPGYSGPFSSTGPSNFSPNVGFPGFQSHHPGTNPYAIPPSVSNVPGFPAASVAPSASLPNQFINQWANMGMTPAQFGQIPTNPQHNPLEMFARLGGFPMPSFNLNQGFPAGQNPFQDQARMPGPGQTNQANQLNPPWPGALPPTPQFQQFLQQFPQQFQSPPMPNAQSEQNWYSSPPKSDPREDLISQLLKTTFIELKKTMKKDLGRKMVESSAFKSLETWWDDCERKSKEPLKVVTDNEKPSPKVQPSPLMSLSFGSRTWNIGSRPWNQGLSQGKNLGLESIGLGLGVRATMPRMPSFKLKRKVPEEEDQEKKPRAQTPQLLDEDVSDTEQEKDGKPSEKQPVRKHRKSVVSDEDEDDEEEEDDEEDDEEDEDEEEDADVKVSKEVDVEEEDEDLEEDEDEEDEDEESDSDFEDEISSLKSGSESSEDEEEEEEEEASDMSDSDESSSGSEISSSEESDSDDEAKDTSRKELKEKLAKIPEEVEEEQEAKKETEEVKEASVPKKADKKAVNGDVSQKEAVKDKAEEKKSKTKISKDLSDKTRKDAGQAESETKPSEKDQEAVQDSKPGRTTRLDSFEMLVELATKARSELLEDVPNVSGETDTSSEKNKGLPSAQEAIKKGTVEGSQDAKLPELLESIEEEVVMESVEDMEMQIGAKKATKAALPKEAADDQQPLPFLDHSYCQRPPPSPPKESPPKESPPKESPPKDIANQVLSHQPMLKLVKLDLSDQELPATPKAAAATTESEEIIDVVSDANVDVTPKKQKSGKRKHKVEPSLEEEVAVPVPSKPEFMPRNYYEEWGLLYQILAAGIDQEDSYYLRKSYESMMQEGRIPWLSYTHWVLHPLTAIPDPPKKKRKVDDVRIHGTGSGRTEGFYKITTQEKKKYLARLRTLPQDKGENNEDSSVAIKASGGKHMQLSREARSDQRRAMATLTRQDGAVSDLLKFNQLKFRKKDLKFLKSGIHGWGLYAMQPISADEMVIEYVGESIRQSVADERETRYEKIGIGSSYLFRIDADAIIDATLTGNLARFINHSCTPNCYAKIISMESQKKIVIYSKQNISTGEEITYDYKFPIEDEKIPCLCGTTQCRGTLN
ncbi:histone-lysine N-methyltransferase SETD1B-A-like isoform X2 [Patiria miniata]|uniref:[histone H3]-lysine(4) N-trimethyltransferase n=1 Tax=Patiria miniata TaxID=46514 RepID=A0A913ZWP3_PATMI|nr:histone-lysine N-methyltransferase SETD1B-A-like isoform X2 [Patiria miniata]